MAARGPGPRRRRGPPRRRVGVTGGQDAVAVDAHLVLVVREPELVDRVQDVVAGGAQIAVRGVGEQGVVEEEALLRDQHHTRPQRCLGDLAPLVPQQDIVRVSNGAARLVEEITLAEGVTRRQMDFVKPAYASIQLSAIQHEDDNRDFLSLDDLIGKRLGVLANSGIEAQARGALGRAVRAYEHIHDALHDLAGQKLDLVIEENLIAEYHIEKHHLPLKVAAPFAAPIAVGLGVRKGHRQMNETLSNAVRQILKDGSFKPISEKWFGYDVSRSRISHSTLP